MWMSINNGSMTIYLYLNKHYTQVYLLCMVKGCYLGFLLYFFQPTWSKMFYPLVKYPIFSWKMVDYNVHVKCIMCITKRYQAIQFVCLVFTIKHFINSIRHTSPLLISSTRYNIIVNDIIILTYLKYAYSDSTIKYSVIILYIKFYLNSTMYTSF